VGGKGVQGALLVLRVQAFAPTLEAVRKILLVVKAEQFAELIRPPHHAVRWPGRRRRC
jgi:hypothetical protein